MSEERQDGTTQPLRVLVAEKLYAPEEITGPVAVVLAGASIGAIWRVGDRVQVKQLCAEQMPGAEIEINDLGSWCIAPGYIDIHTHGFHGHDITSGTQEDIVVMARELTRTGVTSFFPTVATTGKAETVAQIQRIAAIVGRQEHEPEAEILGIRLEGPFISHAKKGAQYEPAIRRPDPVEMRELAAIVRGLVRIVDYAPEEDEGDSFLATLVELGILPCIGHTAATYERVIRAIDGGARHSTHLFNAMSRLDHRQPGTAGALLTDTRTTVEVIADGIHLHPAILRLALAARGPHDIALITDAVVAAGLPDGEYEFINRTVQVANGSVRLADGTLAGSVLTLDRAVRNMVALAGSSWSDAIRMATLTPATITSVSHRKGKVAPGMDADLVVLDEQGCVQQTWVHGQLVYR
ncbi:MAG TPA: N-acetylglucosamine-6-phosphate deacetylase [Ktedonobacteraceae bacterium]|nr:N-acetylglucosamine-6-phosphate deacetylase [Ktedonobacteraceae bacterium]